jgi:Trk K+ transport system NAD-binding subunit
VVTKIEDEQYQPICRHLGLGNIIVPDLEVGRSIADMVEGEEKTSLSTRLGGDLRFFTFIAGAEQAVRCDELDLPEQARVLAVTSGQRSVLGQPDTKINEGDEVVLITDAKHAPALRKRFANDKENQKNGTNES